MIQELQIEKILKFFLTELLGEKKDRQSMKYTHFVCLVGLTCGIKLCNPVRLQSVSIL